eukprot:g7648.t1
MSNAGMKRGLPVVKGYNTERRGGEKTETKQSQSPNDPVVKRKEKDKDLNRSMGSIRLKDNTKRLFAIDFGDLDEVNVPGFQYSKYTRKSSKKKLDPLARSAWGNDTSASSKRDGTRSTTKLRRSNSSTVTQTTKGEEMPKTGLDAIQFLAFLIK